MKRFLLLLLAGIGLTNPSQAEISNDVYQKCINARDFLGCTKVYSDKKPPNQSRDIFSLMDKINNNPNIDDYDKKRTLSAFAFSYLRCIGGTDKREGKIKASQTTKYLRDNNISLSISMERGTLELANKLYKKYKNKCNLILDLDPYPLSSEINFKSEFNTVVVKKPECNVSWGGGGNEELLYNLACLVCQDAFEDNLSSKSSLLSRKDVDQNSNLFKQFINIENSLDKQDGTSTPFKEKMERSYKGYLRTIDTAKIVCPSLY